MSFLLLYRKFLVVKKIVDCLSMNESLIFFFSFFSFFFFFSFLFFLFFLKLLLSFSTSLSLFPSLLFLHSRDPRMTYALLLEEESGCAYSSQAYYSRNPSTHTLRPDFIILSSFSLSLSFSLLFCFLSLFSFSFSISSESFLFLEEAVETVEEFFNIRFSPVLSTSSEILSLFLSFSHHPSLPLFSLF